MNDISNGRGRKQWLRFGRPGVLTGAVAGIALLAAACTSSTGALTTTGGGSSGGPGQAAKDVAYSQCMRAHGEPAFPDPNSQGNFRLPASIQPGSTQFLSANQACIKLLPNGGQISPVILQKLLTRALNFAVCMRSHGIANYPDPVQVAGGVSTILPPGTHIDQSSKQFVSAQATCQKANAGAVG